MRASSAVPLLAPFLCLVVCLRVLGLGRAFLAVGLSLVSCFVSSRVWLLFVVFLLCWCFCLRFCGCLFFGLCVPLLVWWGFFAFVLFLAVVGSPRLLLPPSPVVDPLWRPGPVSVLVPPSGYLAAFATARLPCLNAWGVVVLCRPHFIWSHGSKGLWPCVGLYYPLHHVACVVAVLCTPTQRYSSADDPGPHWTPLSYTVAILGNKCGILRSCPLLPSRRPLFLLLVWLWLCSLVFGAFLLFIQSPCLHLGVRSLELRCLREFLRLVCLRC